MSDATVHRPLLGERPGAFWPEWLPSPLALGGVFLAVWYAYFYLSFPETPGNAFLAGGHGLGWMGWYDQGKTYDSTLALAARNFHPEAHWYPLGYAILGAPFIMSLHGHAFFFVDLVSLLADMQEMLVAAPGAPGPAQRDGGENAAASARPAPWPTLDLVDEEPETTEGYRVGRERRSRIVRDATALFARDGYADTSLREIAERVGVSKSALLHHYPSKDALLRAVLAERDRAISVSPPAHAQRAADALRDLPRNAAINAASAPGLIEVYAVLSCEALPPDHPAHDYFTQRFAATIDHFTAVLRAAQQDGDLPAHRDPAREAIRLVALWDGLQYQWLYDRESVDVAAHLAAHLDDILPRR